MFSTEIRCYAVDLEISLVGYKHCIAPSGEDM